MIFLAFVKSDPIQEMKGGLSLWRGKPWWFVLPEDWRAADPQKLANRLLPVAEDSPEELAAQLGCELFFPLTQGRLGKWSLELRKRHMDPSRLPDIQQRLAWRSSLPIPVHPDAQRSALPVWSRLAPLLGLDVASSVLKTMLIPWEEWASRKPWHAIRLNNLKELFAKDYAFRDAWAEFTPAKRSRVFTEFMGPGRCLPSDLEDMATIDDHRTCLDLMAELWCGRTTKPNSFSPRNYLALALAYPGCDFGHCQLEENNVEKLLWNPDKISPEKLQLIIKNGVLKSLPVEGIAQSILSTEELQYALDHGLELSIQGYQDPALSSHYFRLCRNLLDAGFPARFLKHSQLIERSGNRAAFAYILVSQLEVEMSESQLKALDQLAPAGGFLDNWRELPIVQQSALPRLAFISKLLQLDLDELTQYCRLRLALGKSLLSKRLVTWTLEAKREEVKNLRILIAAEPERQELIAQLNRVRTASPDKKERKRCAKEVKLGLENLPKELWSKHITGVSERLLTSLLGSEIVTATPRAGRLLHVTDLPVERLTLLRSQHPNNENWLRTFERAGFSAAHWLDGLRADIVVQGKFIELRTETDPSEILEMGTHFETCLSLDDGFNAFSVLTNILEANKMVLIGRNLEGKVMIRKLIAVTQKGHLLGYQTYSHLQGATEPVQEACRNFAHKNGLTLVDRGEPERIIHDLPWYDDGPEAWVLRETPENMPEDWPKDQAAIQQWNTQELSRGNQVDDFSVTRSVEVFHKILQGKKLDHDIDLAEDWYWDSAIERLAFLERFDILQERRVHKNPSEMFYSLEQQCGLRPEFADDYVAFFDPEHKLYRKESLHPNNINSLEISGLWLLADPRVIRKTCAGLARSGCLDPLSSLFDQLAEVLTLCLIRNPEDQAWHKFEEPALVKLMVEVGARLAVPQWLDIFRKATDKEPDWGKAWFARARVEGENILALLRNKLRCSRRSLNLALAMDCAGECPEDYILPRPKTLCSSAYLNRSRRLRKLIEPRLARLKSKNFSPSELRMAKRWLNTPDTLDWHSWSNEVRDPELDAEISHGVVNSGDFTLAGAWVNLGTPRLRLSVLYHLGAKLTDHNREILAIQNDEVASRFGELLVHRWLKPEKEFDQDEFITPNTLLAWEDWPDEIESVLEKLELENFVEVFQEGAEFLDPKNLKTLFKKVVKKREYSFADIENELTDPQHSVELQKLLLTQVSDEPSPGLSKTERGKWARWWWETWVQSSARDEYP